MVRVLRMLMDEHVFALTLDFLVFRATPQDGRAPFFFDISEPCRRRTPRSRADLRVARDAPCRDLSDATLRFDPALGVRRRHAPKKSPKIDPRSDLQLARLIGLMIEALLDKNDVSAYQRQADERQQYARPTGPTAPLYGAPLGRLHHYMPPHWADRTIGANRTTVCRSTWPTAPPYAAPLGRPHHHKPPHGSVAVGVYV